MEPTPLAPLIELEGRWTGTNRLWVHPDEPHDDSEMTVRIEPVLGGRFVRLDYTWGYKGEPQEGALLFGYDAKRDLVTAVWIDTWHMGDKAMSCAGEPGARRIAVKGSYGDDTGQAWGWWTEVEPSEPDAFFLRMYNVPPGGERVLATEAKLSRERSSVRRA